MPTHTSTPKHTRTVSIKAFRCTKCAVATLEPQVQHARLHCLPFSSLWPPLSFPLTMFPLPPPSTPFVCFAAPTTICVALVACTRSPNPAQVTPPEVGQDWGRRAWRLGEGHLKFGISCRQHYKLVATCHALLCRAVLPRSLNTF